jgi:phage-related protein
MIRQVLFYGNYFEEFFEKQNAKVKAKIDYVLYLIAHVERVPEKFLKHIEGSEGLYEIRVKAGSNIFRIFCFFDEGKLIVLLNAFQKKTQKTPKNEIALAERLKQEYFKEKLKGGR